MSCKINITCMMNLVYIIIFFKKHIWNLTSGHDLIFEIIKFTLRVECLQFHSRVTIDVVLEA